MSYNLKPLFQFEKKEWLFQILAYILPITLFLLFFFNYLDNAFYFQFNIFFPIYFVLCLLIYKYITNASEFQLFRTALLFILFLELFVLLSSLYPLKYEPNPLSGFISNLFLTFGSFVLLTYSILGLTALIYSKKSSYKLLFLVLFSICLSILIFLIFIYLKISIFAPYAVVKIIFSAINIVLFFYAYDKINPYLPPFLKPIPSFFLSFVVILYVILFIGNFFSAYTEATLSLKDVSFNSFGNNLLTFLELLFTGLLLRGYKIRKPFRA